MIDPVTLSVIPPNRAVVVKEGSYEWTMDSMVLLKNILVYDNYLNPLTRTRLSDDVLLKLDEYRLEQMKIVTVVDKNLSFSDKRRVTSLVFNSFDTVGDIITGVSLSRKERGCIASMVVTLEGESLYARDLESELEAFEKVTTVRVEKSDDVVLPERDYERIKDFVSKYDRYKYEFSPFPAYTRRETYKEPLVLSQQALPLEREERTDEMTSRQVRSPFATSVWREILRRMATEDVHTWYPVRLGDQTVWEIRRVRDAVDIPTAYFMPMSDEDIRYIIEYNEGGSPDRNPHPGLVGTVLNMRVIEGLRLPGPITRELIVEVLEAEQQRMSEFETEVVDDFNDPLVNIQINDALGGPHEDPEPEPKWYPVHYSHTNEAGEKLFVWDVFCTNTPPSPPREYTDERFDGELMCGMGDSIMSGTEIGTGMGIPAGYVHPRIGFNAREMILSGNGGVLPLP